MSSIAENGLAWTGLIGLRRTGLLRLWYDDFLVIIRNTDAGLALGVGVGGRGTSLGVIVVQDAIAKERRTRE